MAKSKTKYCRWCGSQMVEKEKPVYSLLYDEDTGKRDGPYILMKCPQSGKGWKSFNPFELDWHDEWVVTKNKRGEYAVVE